MLFTHEIQSMSIKSFLKSVLKKPEKEGELGRFLFSAMICCVFQIYNLHEITEKSAEKQIRL